MTKAQQILAFAREQVGEPYRIGAAGWDVWDCSGLTKMAVKQIGYFWYHGATTQWNRGLGIKDSGCKDLPAWLGYWSDHGTIDTLPSNQVAFLFNQDRARTDKLVMAHTGIYDGRGNVIQAGGQYKGVSDKPINRNRWSHWATLKGVDEVAEDRVLKYTQPYMRGDDVRQVQNRLIALGYGVGSKGADGVFGQNTLWAVNAFQTERGLPVDGIVGASTLAALNATTAPTGSGTTPPTPLQVDLLTAELDALKIAINALYAHVDKIITMVRG